MASPRHIAHFDLDTFFVSVERLKDPSLIGKPVIVGGSMQRGVVSSCSYEARKFGVHSAMPGNQAYKLCPQAIFVKGSLSDYSKYSRQVTDIILSKVPVVEKASIDEFYMDLTGMDRFFGTFQYVADLKALITKETGLPISFALASNKLISKIATNEAKPNGQIEIPHGTEQAYLAPMPVQKFPGVGGKMQEFLNAKGIYKIHQITETPIELLESWLGKYGPILHRKSMGIDENPVISYHEQKSISSENTFENDTDDITFLHNEIVRITERIGFELREESKMTGCITIKLRYDNFETITKQKTIDYTASDHVIIRQAKDLFAEAYNPRRKLRLLGVRLSHLVENTYQLSLFDDTSETISLYNAIDDIKRNFGKAKLFRAGSMLSEEHKDLKVKDPLWFNRNAKERRE